MRVNNLIPTVVVDKNNKLTTVHKRSGASSPAAGKLGSVKPTVGSAPKRAVSKAVFSEKSGTTYLGTGSGSFLERVGVSGDADELLRQSDGEGTVEVPDDVLYDYLRLGIRIPEAAVLHKLSNGRLDKLQEHSKFAAALPGTLVESRIWGGKQAEDRTITETVDFLANAGIKPSKVEAVLANNMNDKLLERNVLPPEQLADLFTRFNYSLSKDEERGTSASRLMDAVLDGRLPFALINKKNNVSRPVASIAYDLLYSKKSKHNEVLSAERRQELIDDPEMLVMVCRSISNHKIGWTNQLSPTHDAIKKYGFDACMEYNPREMMKKRFDGELVGPEGVQAMNDIRDLIEERIEPTKKSRTPQRLTYQLDRYVLSESALQSVNIWTEDVAGMVSLGYTAEQIVDDFFTKRQDSREMIALSSGDTIPAIVEGWL